MVDHPLGVLFDALSNGDFPDRTLLVVGRSERLPDPSEGWTKGWKQVVASVDEPIADPSIVHIPVNVTGVDREDQVRYGVFTAALMGHYDPVDPLTVWWDQPGETGVADFSRGFPGYEWKQVSALSALADSVHPSVLFRAIDAGLLIARKKCGALIVIDDWKNIQDLCVPVAFNPFEHTGSEGAWLHLYDDHALDMIAKIARLDHAFQFAREGRVERLILNISPPGASSNEGHAVKSSGLGSRHTTARRLAASTDALTMTVQDSDGTLRLYFHGKEILKLRTNR